MHIDWSWVISAVIAAVISSLIRSGKGRAMSARVTALEEEVKVLREKLGVAPPPITTQIQPVAVPQLATGSGYMEGLIRQGKKIEAIKVYREQTRVGLKEAKEAVEAMERRMKYGA
jgi:ribosomal protein L7/L12